MPLELLQRPTFVRLVLGIVLLILPLLTWVDYRQGYHAAAMTDLLAAVALLTLTLFIRQLGVARVARIALIVVFVLAAIGSLDKLGSTPNLAWLPVMPVLYVFLGGLRFGGLLTVGHYAFISAGVLVLPTLPTPIDASIWLQVSLAYWTAAALAISYEYVQQHLTERLQTLAEHDRLTGLLNRRGMEKRLRDLADFLSRHDVVVTLALLDIDHFKRVNDQHGHAVGDAVLEETGRELTAGVRGSDYVARWGGEEFLIALTRTGVDDATDVLDRLRARIAASRQLPVTLSVGVTEWRPGEDLDSALKRADTALYDAKQGGRNRLATVSEAGPELKERHMERAFRAQRSAL